MKMGRRWTQKVGGTQVHVITLRGAARKFHGERGGSFREVSLPQGKFSDAPKIVHRIWPTLKLALEIIFALNLKFSSQIRKVLSSPNNFASNLVHYGLKIRYFRFFLIEKR